MIEEAAVVTAVDADGIWVEKDRSSTCGGCSANKVCGIAALSRALGRKRLRAIVFSDQAVSVGDQVVVGLEEAALLRGSMLIYGLPLLLLIAGALLGQLAGGHDAGALVGAAFGVGVSIISLRFLRQRMLRDPRFQPNVLRIH